MGGTLGYLSSARSTLSLDHDCEKAPFTMVNRRSDEERIAALQAKIEMLRSKAVEASRPDQAVLREAPKLHKKLREFAQLAHDHGRNDVANSIVAFMAGLDRMIQELPEPPRKPLPRRAGDEFAGMRSGMR